PPPEAAAAEQGQPAEDGDRGDEQIPKAPAPGVAAEEAAVEVLHLVAVCEIRDARDDPEEPDCEEQHGRERQPARAAILVTCHRGHVSPPLWLPAHAVADAVHRPLLLHRLPLLL